MSTNADADADPDAGTGHDRRPEGNPPPHTPVRAVLFDFGHTLFAHAPGPEVLRREASLLGHDLTPDEAFALWREIDTAAMDPAEVARGRDLDGEVWRTRWPILYGLADRVVPGIGAALDRDFHDAWSWIPYADTEAVLHGLADRGIAVGVVSNTGWDVRGPFAARGLDRFVGSFTLSYECGIAKPEPGIFLAACQALDVDPGLTLMVGDDARADTGALAAGLLDVVLVDPDTPIGDPHGLDQVLERVDSQP